MEGIKIEKPNKNKKQPTLVCFPGDEGGAVMAIGIGSFLYCPFDR